MISPAAHRIWDGGTSVYRSASYPHSPAMSLKNPVTSASFSLSNATAVATTQAGSLATPPELEQTLASLTSHRSVLGYMLLSRGQPATIIRHSGVIFEGEQGKKYASAISRIVESVQAGLEDVSGDSTDVVSTLCAPAGRCPLTHPSNQDEVRFMRIRTKRHEIMISPGQCSGPLATSASVLTNERES